LSCQASLVVQDNGSVSSTLENIVGTQMNSLLKHATNVGDKKTIL